MDYYRLGIERSIEFGIILKEADILGSSILPQISDKIVYHDYTFWILIDVKDSLQSLFDVKKSNKHGRVLGHKLMEEWFRGMQTL